MPTTLKKLAQAIVGAAVMALISAALRQLARVAAPAWVAYPPPFGELAFLIFPALLIGGFISARYIAPRSVAVAMAGGFLFMALVSWSRGARPWWLALLAGGLFAALAGGGAILARRRQRTF